MRGMISRRPRPAALVIATLLLLGSLAMALPASRAIPSTPHSSTSSAPPPLGAEAPRPAAEVSPVAGLAAAEATIEPEFSTRARRVTPTVAPTPTPEPTPEPRAPLVIPEVGRATTARFAPAGIAIPRIGVEARIESLGVTPEGQMEDPDDYGAVGWYRHGPTPGEAGRAVMAGHLDSQTGPAVFYRLGDLAPGDEIVVRRGGQAGDLVFVVRETARYRTAEVPLDRVYGPSERPELVLITCAGAFDRGARAYDERLIVVAELRVAETAAPATGG